MQDCHLLQIMFDTLACLMAQGLPDKALQKTEFSELFVFEHYKKMMLKSNFENCKKTRSD